MTRVLAVCLGNICRSPSAEAVIRKLAADRGIDLVVDSAGTSDWHVGDPPYGPAIRAASVRGYDLKPLRARQFGPDDFMDFDLILAMDAANARAIEALRPRGDTTPVQLMMDYAPDASEREVPDPYYTRDFDGALDLIEEAAAGLLDQLQKASAV